jgi:hypothetical protein
MHTDSSWPVALKAPFQGVAKHARCMVVVAGMSAVLMLSTVVPSRQWPNDRSTTAQRLAAPFKGSLVVHALLGYAQSEHAARLLSALSLAAHAESVRLRCV